MKTDTESHAMRCAQEILWGSGRVPKRIFVVLLPPRRPTCVEIECEDGFVHVVDASMLGPMMAAIKKDRDESQKTVAEIKALKRMEDLA